jgi:hypothetical protein
VRLVGWRVEGEGPRCWRVWRGETLRLTVHSPEARVMVWEDVLKMCRAEMLDHAWCADEWWLHGWGEGAGWDAEG